VRLAAALSLILVAMPMFTGSAQARRTVPATIDATGATDVTAELERFVDSVPNGETVAFPRRATYRIDGTLEWRDRRRLTLDGNGARLVAGAHGDANRAHIRLIDGGRWKIRDLIVRGAKPTGGRFDPDYQWQHGLDLRGVHGAALENVTVSDVFGDDIYVGLSTTSSAWSRDISIVDCTGLRSGRMAVAITAGRRVTVSGGVWSEPGLSTFDVEPNGRPGGADRILIENATLGAGSRARALDITGSGPVSNVTMRDNRLTGRPLHVRVDQGDERPRNIVVEGNRSTVEFAGPAPAALVFRNTDGITVARNTQSLRPYAHLALVATYGSTGVDVSGQQMPPDSEPSVPCARYLVGLGVALILLTLYRHSARRAAVNQRAR
jgi:hypothetical protein